MRSRGRPCFSPSPSLSPPHQFAPLTLRTRARTTQSADCRALARALAAALRPALLASALPKLCVEVAATLLQSPHGARSPPPPSPSSAAAAAADAPPSPWALLELPALVAAAACALACAGVPLADLPCCGASVWDLATGCLVADPTPGEARAAGGPLALAGLLWSTPGDELSLAVALPGSGGGRGGAGAGAGAGWAGPAAFADALDLAAEGARAAAGAARDALRAEAAKGAAAGGGGG